MSNVLTGLKRGALHRCPACGESKLFRQYLKVDPACAACGNDNAQYPADDAPPYFTILIVGHLVIAPVLFFPHIWQVPMGLLLGISLPILIVLTLVLLPRVKGAIIGLQWAIRENHAARDATR